MTKTRGKKKKSVAPKTRKEQRKEKRQLKKINKKNFFEKKKTKPGHFVKAPQHDEKIKNNKEKFQDDSEIESDFELSDDEMQVQLQKVTKIAKKPAKQILEVDRFHENQQREKKKQQEIQKKMRKRRVEQLIAANEDEDKVIRKLEKQLKIDHQRSEKSVPRMFNDGLDYALELCLPENIQKMYSAAKEAAEVENSDDDFQKDFNIALGKSQNQDKKKTKDVKKRKEVAGSDKSEIKSKNREAEGSEKSETKSKNREAKLKKIESKYFKESDSEFSGSDSEFQDSDLDEGGSTKKAKNNSKAEDVSDEESDLSESGEDEGLSDEAGDGLDDIMKGLDDDEVSMSGSEGESDNDEEGEERQTKSDVEADSEEDKKLWEDIYGRKRDEDGNVINESSSGKYIPPHVRARMDAEAETEVDEKRKEKLKQLKRQCKGFLNRLSEANMHKIASDIENLYMKNSRFDMNNTLTALIVESLISNVLAKERMVLEHSLLLAVLHANVGSEVGAHFLQTLVLKFDKLAKNIKSLDVENKELDNVVFLIAHMYTFKIFQHNLIYEMMNSLTTNLCEKSVESLLLVLRAVGFSLRKDDPIALKEFIFSIQKTVNTAPLELKENPRLKFMLDILNAIKNNNVNKIPQYDPTLAEHLRKILKSMLTNGKYIGTLNITMEDLMRAEEKGKWWVVGSAWSGNIKDIGSATDSRPQDRESKKFSEQLLALAKKQRMNTEDRKNVFCILMSAEDYIDAFERLLHLSIKDHRVIISIIIHCCLSEKTFNPYYAVLSQKFCEYDRKYQLAMQFSLWDRIKDIHSVNTWQITNLAQLLIHLIVNGGLAISVLKVVEFGELDKSTLRLVRQIMLAILLGNEDTCRQVFERIAPSFKLNAFKDALRLFLHHFLVKGGNKSGVSADQIDMLKSRVSIADKALETIDSRVKL